MRAEATEEMNRAQKQSDCTWKRFQGQSDIQEWYMRETERCWCIHRLRLCYFVKRQEVLVCMQATKMAFADMYVEREQFVAEPLGLRLNAQALPRD